MFKQITVIGDGAMGSVCAAILCENGLDVTMWGHDAGQLGQIAANRENTIFLPGYKLPDSLQFESDDAAALDGAEMVLSAVPCQFTRGVWERLRDKLAPGVPVVSVTKGIEKGSLLLASEIISTVLGGGHNVATLSGPTIADELMGHLPATACTASADADLVHSVQETFNSSYFRVYTNDDIVGVEVSGALKNVIAIAAGIIDGIGAGDNAKAALVTRGLAEIERLGLAMGAKEKTFSGLSGLGDLVTTCISPKGRNRSFGERIGRGLSAADALDATKSVVEGAATCESVLVLAEKYCVEMPIAEAVNAVIRGEKSVEEAIGDLMSRELKAE
jgi:glycerol-3-phosphate dehydrogenase (NAD(P)+)